MNLPRIPCEKCNERQATHRVYVKGEKSACLCNTCMPTKYEAAFALND